MLLLDIYLIIAFLSKNGFFFDNSNLRSLNVFFEPSLAKYILEISVLSKKWINWTLPVPLFRNPFLLSFNEIILSNSKSVKPIPLSSIINSLNTNFSFSAEKRFLVVIFLIVIFFWYFVLFANSKDSNELVNASKSGWSLFSLFFIFGRVPA